MINVRKSLFIIQLFKNKNIYMQYTLVFNGQILVIGLKYQKYIKKIKINTLRKKMFFIDHGEDIQTYTRVKTFW